MPKSNCCSNEYSIIKRSKKRYSYKADSLMKQTFSITSSTGQHLQLISYYPISHPGSSEIQQPSNDTRHYVKPPRTCSPPAQTLNYAQVPPAYHLVAIGRDPSPQLTTHRPLTTCAAWHQSSRLAQVQTTRAFESPCNSFRRVQMVLIDPEIGQGNLLGLLPGFSAISGPPQTLLSIGNLFESPLRSPYAEQGSAPAL
ncbi:cAMP-independent regulatory protein pac2 [Colletotrichum truncatum]|uniref:cAMP-independent regulatory protein pac2 n=1 Tax=Colletotrichum truncatum TaxID=5467 RepID=A0ACC3YQ59_COLTU